MQPTRHLVITGRVQRVGFRHAMIDEAQALGVRGWVRNRSDGTVEAVIQGEPDAIAAMLAWARHGPRAARVQAVEVEYAQGELGDFVARPTE